MDDGWMDGVSLRFYFTLHIPLKILLYRLKTNHEAL